METLKDRLRKLLAEYSIATDTPTVIKELLKLSATVEFLFNEVDELEKLVNELDPKSIKQLLEEIRAEIADAEGKAAQALTAANAADGKADQAVTTAGEAQTSAAEAGTKAEAASTAAGQAQSTATEALNAAEGAMTLINQVQGNLTALTTRVNALETKATKNAEDIAELQTLTTAQGEDISKNMGDIAALQADKQDKLTFDSTPTENSQNPVTSDGIYKAIQAGDGSITLDDTVTPYSKNGVKSSGIYSAIETAKTQLQNEINNTNTTVSAQADEISALQEFQQTQESTNSTHNQQISSNTTAIQNLQTGKQDSLYVQVEMGTLPNAEIKSQVPNEESEIEELNPSSSEPHQLITAQLVKYIADQLRSSISEKPDPYKVYVFSAADYAPMANEVLNSIGTNPPAIDAFINALGVYNALLKKQDKLTFDNTPTENSNNPVTSGGIYTAIQEAAGGGGVIPVVKKLHGKLAQVDNWATQPIAAGIVPIAIQLELNVGTSSNIDICYVNVNLLGDTTRADKEFSVCSGEHFTASTYAMWDASVNCVIREGLTDPQIRVFIESSTIKEIASDHTLGSNKTIRSGTYTMDVLDFTGGAQSLELIEDDYPLVDETANETA